MPVLRHVDSEYPTSFMFRLDGLAANRTADAYMFAQFVDSLKGHSRLGACYQVSALWVEVDLEVGLQLFVESLFGAFNYIL